MKYPSKLFAALFALMLAFGFNTKAQFNSDEVSQFSAALDIINLFYVDTVNSKKLTEHAIVSMLEELDPHSTYIPKKEVEAVNEPLKGNFEGVGIQFNILRDTILVVNTIPGGPSEKVGLMAGDKIIIIDKENVAGIGMQNSGVVDRLRGDKGTEVDVSILRRGEKDLLEFTITRDKIPLFSLDAAYMVDDEIGYIKINRFSATTTEEFKQALKELNDEGMKHLILDLQSNGGGYLNAAIEMADELLDQNKMIVYTEGNNSPKREYKATTRGLFEDGKLVVLVNEGSASASEIVSGAVQDWDRGVIVGRKTFGKGLVQKPYALPDGGIIRLTIAEYYTPSGRCIQRPYKGGTEEYYKDFEKRMAHGEMMYMDSIQLPDSLMFYTNNNRPVYGGGGILPDVFVPLDTSMNSDWFNKVFRKGTVNNFVLTYLDHNRADLLSKYESFDAFNADFDPQTDIMDDFLAFADKKGVEFSEEGFEKSGEALGIQIKGLIARNLWEQENYYQVVNNMNDIFLQAVDVIKNGDFEMLGIADK